MIDVETCGRYSLLTALGQVKIKEEKDVVKNIHEENRPPREFKENWKEGRERLMYDDQIGIRCAVCIDAGDNIIAPKNNFITGSKLF